MIITHTLAADDCRVASCRLPGKRAQHDYRASLQIDAGQEMGTVRTASRPMVCHQHKLPFPDCSAVLAPFTIQHRGTGRVNRLVIPVADTNVVAAAASSTPTPNGLRQCGRVPKCGTVSIKQSSFARSRIFRTSSAYSASHQDEAGKMQNDTSI